MMDAVRGARNRPALYTTFCMSARPGMVLGESRASLFKLTSLFVVWPEVQALDLPGDTLWVDGSGRAPNDSPFRTCSWAVVGRGVLVQARLTGPAQSVYRAELLALVTALQGSEPQATVVSDCKSACRVVQKLLGREVKWIKAHTDRRIAVLHGVSEVDRQGNERADKAANNVLAPVDGRQSTWGREKKEKLLARPQLPEEEDLIDELEWPYVFETAGLRCLECGKGASDIAGRPRWLYFRELFHCVPKRRRGRPRRTLQLA
eukprot:1912854-Amphidinium_carterae.2